LGGTIFFPLLLNNIFGRISLFIRLELPAVRTVQEKKWDVEKEKGRRGRGRDLRRSVTLITGF